MARHLMAVIDFPPAVVRVEGYRITRWGRHGFDGEVCGREAYRGVTPVIVARNIIANQQLAYAA